MVQGGWYMVQESKLWYDYIIMVRSGNAVATRAAYNCAYELSLYRHVLVHMHAYVGSLNALQRT